MNGYKYLELIKGVKNKEELRKLNETIRCDNDKLVFTQDVYTKQEVDIIPLFYGSLWICFTFDEIFMGLYSIIKSRNLPLLIDPLFPQKVLDDTNTKIVLQIDKLFNNSNIYKLLESKKVMDRQSTLREKLFQKLEKKSPIVQEIPINTENIYELEEFYQKLNRKQDIELNIYLLTDWLESLSTPDRRSIENYKVYVDGKYTEFGRVIDSCTKTPDLCIKSIITSIKYIVDKEKKERGLQKRLNLDIITEEDE